MHAVRTGHTGAPTATIGYKRTRSVSCISQLSQKLFKNRTASPESFSTSDRVTSHMHHSPCQGTQSLSSHISIRPTRPRPPPALPRPATMASLPKRIMKVRTPRFLRCLAACTAVVRSSPPLRLAFRQRGACVVVVIYMTYRYVLCEVADVYGS